MALLYEVMQYKKGDKECQHCGITFQGTSQTKACSDKCRATLRNRRKGIGVPQTVHCPICSKTVTSSRLRIYCSDECKKKANKVTTKKTTSVCKGCGKDFKQKMKKSGIQIYCSKKCLVANKEYQLTRTAVCKRCSLDYLVHTSEGQSISFCSNECKYKLISYTCAECLQTFKTTNTFIIKYCSKKCAAAMGKRNRRAILNKAYVEDVSRGFIFRRDKGICQICNQPVRFDRPHPYPLSPSIDHIFPLSKGGLHKKSNCQLAHLRCNLMKHDKVLA